MDKLRKNIKFLRKAAGITQAELAEQIGCTTQFVGLIETGKRRPGLSLLLRICDFFEVSIDDIIKKEVSSEAFFS